MTGDGSISREGRKEGLKTMAWGLGWIVGAVWFWLYLVGNPIHDLRLMLYAKTASGQIIDTWEDVEDGTKGEAHWFHGAAYTFRLPNGRGVRASTRERSGRLRPEFRDLAHPIAVEVEYDPLDPSINRIEGDGSQSLVDWLLRKVGLGGLLLILFVSPGVKVIRDGVRTLRAGSTKLASEGDA